MSAIADTIEFLLSLSSKDPARQCCAETKYTGSMTAACALFFFATMAVIRVFTKAGEYSYVLTLGAGIQCLGFLILNFKVKFQQTVAGLSSRTMEMYAMFFVLRLSSTLFFEGYLPVDKTGDHVYQCADIGSLVLVLNLLYSIHRRFKSTYQSELDTLAIYKCVPALFLFSWFVYGNLNPEKHDHFADHFFDRVWMASLLFDTVALVPQLWMLSNIGQVESLTSHFVATLVVSRCLSTYFWFYGQVALKPKDGSPNIAGPLIVGFHALQVLLAADFMYYYVKAVASGGCAGISGSGGMSLPTIDL